jgi:acetyl esterase/lipase
MTHTARVVVLCGGVLLACSGGESPEPLELAVRLEETYEVFPDIRIGAEEGCEVEFDLFYPKEVTEPPPVLLYFHGGGWDGGSREQSILSLLPYLVMNFAVLNVDYRLSPVAPAPAAVEDCRCALAWLIRHAEEYYFDAMRIVLTGHSAGGHLALLTGMLPLDTDESYRIAGIVNWYGPTDITDLIDDANAREWARRWLDTEQDRSEIARYVSPLNHVHADLPPVLTVHGDRDSIVPYSQAERLHSELDHAGVPNRLIRVRDGGHGDFGEQEALRLYREIERFLREQGI